MGVPGINLMRSLKFFSNENSVNGRQASWKHNGLRVWLCVLVAKHLGVGQFYHVPPFAEEDFPVERNGYVHQVDWLCQLLRGKISLCPSFFYYEVAINIGRLRCENEKKGKHFC